MSNVQRLSIVLALGFLVLTGCASRNIVLDSSYVPGEKSCQVVSKKAVGPFIINQGGGLLGDLYSAKTRNAGLKSALENMGVEQRSEKVFLSKLVPSNLSFRLADLPVGMDQFRNTTNYQSLFTEQGVPYLFVVQVRDYGVVVTTGAMGLVATYDANLKLEGSLYDLKENRIIWRASAGSKRKVQGKYDKIMEENGKILTDAMDQMLEETSTQLVSKMSKTAKN